MSGFGTVFFKEFIENLRDRRTILSSLIIGPIAGPLMMVLLFSLMGSDQRERAEATLEIPVVGAENAPNLVDFLVQQGTVIKPAPEDPEGAVRAQDEDVVLRIPADFAEQWQQGQPAAVELIQDASRRQAQTTVRRVSRLINAYGAQVGTLRLQLRGVPANLSSPLVVKDVDLSTPIARAAPILALLPYFLILTVFIGGMSMAIDSTAGEKERRSLEPLLINPVPRWQIVAGKLAATSLFAFVTLLLSLVTFYFVFPMIPADTIGVAIVITPDMLLAILIALAPMALAASALLTILASFAKSFREAQSYMGLVMFIPLLPSMYILASPVKAETWMMAVPLLSHNVLINELVRGDQVSDLWMALCVSTTLALGVIMAAVAVSLYHRPRLVFAGA